MSVLLVQKLIIPSAKHVNDACKVLLLGLNTHLKLVCEQTGADAALHCYTVLSEDSCCQLPVW